MSTPAASAVGRVEAVVANLRNREISVSNPDDLARIMRIVNAFASHWQAQFNAAVADPEAPTNAEFAGFFLLKMKEHGKAILRAEAETAKRKDLSAAIVETGNIAADDLS